MNKPIKTSETLSEPMTIAGLSESLPPAKISMSTATAHGGSFSSLFW
jgi:hypothetical protein